MSAIHVTCTHCGFSRAVPAEKVPDKPVQATCPSCKRQFTFDKSKAAPAVPPFSSQPPPAMPPPAPPPKPAAAGHRDRPSAPPRSASSPAGGTGLKGIGALLSDTWALFQKRFATLFTLNIVALLLCALPGAIATGLAMALAKLVPSVSGGIAALGTLTGILLGAAGFAWGYAALFAAALDDTLGIRASMERARPYVLSMFWVCALTGFVVGGGFLLLVIPGIIFAAWFFMAPFVLLDDDTHGMSALLKSRAMVRGRWFDVFLRLLVIWACSVLLGIIPVVGPLLLLVATPFLVIYQALLFKDVKQAAQPVTYHCGLGDLLRWPAVALAGYVALPALLVGMFGMTMLGHLKHLKRVTKDGSTAIPLPLLQQGTPPLGDGDLRVIPIPVPGGTAAPGMPSPATESGVHPQAAPPVPQGREKSPDDVHVFIYAVNCPGRVLANGIELRQIENRPDMQYNYNMSGSKLRYGQNSIEVEYAPLPLQANMLKPEIHLRISLTGKGQRQVLGDWRISETTAGRRSFDLEIPLPSGEEKHL